MNHAFLMEQHYFFYLTELETEGLGTEDKLESFNSLISINPVAAFCPSCLWQNSIVSYLMVLGFNPNLLAMSPIKNLFIFEL